ncbi:hypothetical protein M3202_06450 [Alkalihalobacillus oceani]|uniref:Uncharacterized protein n=1 Tax=Halalkalibacter oceani TaxID=1653776 RepID=A0A9X2IN45_9BACI|nr:hypothetical protein [Halalkalibacter oceani]MCM3713720.1 hypothetical protein [Halalkalibacter oceani]
MVIPLVIGGSLAQFIVIEHSLRPLFYSLGVKHVYEGLYLVKKELDHPGLDKRFSTYLLIDANSFSKE